LHLQVFISAICPVGQVREQEMQMFAPFSFMHISHFPLENIEQSLDSLEALLKLILSCLSLFVIIGANEATITEIVIKLTRSSIKEKAFFILFSLYIFVRYGFYK